MLDEVELPLSALVVYTWLSYFSILDQNTYLILAMNPCSNVSIVQSREASKEKLVTRGRAGCRLLQVLFLLRLEYRATIRYHTGFPFE